MFVICGNFLTVELKFFFESVLVFKFLVVIWIKFLKDDLIFFLNLQKCWLDWIKSFFLCFCLIGFYRFRGLCFTVKSFFYDRKFNFFF